MQRAPFRLPLLLAAGLAAAGLAIGGATPALAQQRAPGEPLLPNQPEPERRAPPPALPGLSARQAPQPIPADPARAQSLSPNAALFDAIARGDLAAARDAVARGADLNARNVLGLTPLDAAVDQRRDEIAFFLLSARGTAARGTARPPANAIAGTAEGAAAMRGANPARPAVAPRRAAAPPAVVPGAAPPAQPRLFANDGGAPIPEIGFLGFDAGRPPGAAAPAPARGGGRG
ncbi:hypothetical protein GCM10010964_24060 [Caldovatus sediminis]|uniref:Ankyrin repeat domain-containing protein n=1 Tax=Caldovatus sediminis TaxID=2041189 RepID=A0A8J3EBB5_9PROT|nr:ankyrin repeat domain-containing protein [Caldovatus sediminis]GGG35366.1 hypothetical protein GCM10010964_24060 [Caldovatus sediminis]